MLACTEAFWICTSCVQRCRTAKWSTCKQPSCMSLHLLDALNTCLMPTETCCMAVRCMLAIGVHFFQLAQLVASICHWSPQAAAHSQAQMSGCTVSQTTALLRACLKLYEFSSAHWQAPGIRQPGEAAAFSSAADMLSSKIKQEHTCMFQAILTSRDSHACTCLSEVLLPDAV